MNIGSHSFDEFLQQVKSFHGYAAPGVVIGGIMVDLARRQLAGEVLFDAVSETRNCLPDAIQILTPCTIGNGWLKVVNLGRFALSLYDKYSGTGVRVYLDAAKVEGFPEIANWYLKLKPKSDQDEALLLAQIREAGTRIMGLQPVQIRPQFLGKKQPGADSHLPPVPGSLSGPGWRHLPGLPGRGSLPDRRSPGRDWDPSPAPANPAGGAGRGPPGLA